jgi:membrane fusion protein (multidrug efflux system)
MPMRAQDFPVQSGKSLLIGLTIVAACGRPGPPQQANAQAREAETAVPVSTATIERGSIAATIRVASTIEAEQQVTVHAESTGRILSLAIEEGDEVRANQVLARIKYDAQAAALDRANTSLAKAKADFERLEQLHARKVVSNEELEATRVAYDTALLDVRDRARDVRNTRVVAPFSGTVTQRFVSTGQFVASGAQIVTITDFATLVARIYVPEKQLDRVAVGQDAEIKGRAASERSGMGSIVRIAPIVDPTTGTVKVTVALPRALAGGPRGFLPGMYADVTLTTQRKPGVLLAPKRALVRDDERTFVFTVVASRARRNEVILGLEDDAFAEVVSGVDDGAEVVVAGHAGLKEGALVETVPPVASQRASGAAAGDGVVPSSGGV